MSQPSSSNNRKDEALTIKETESNASDMMSTVYEESNAGIELQTLSSETSKSKLKLWNKCRKCGCKSQKEHFEKKSKEEEIHPRFKPKSIKEVDIGEYGKRYNSKKSGSIQNLKTTEGTGSPSTNVQDAAALQDPYTHSKKRLKWYSLTKKILGNFWTWLIVDFLTNLASIIAFNVVSKRFDVVQGCPVVSLTFDIFIVCIWVVERQPCPDSVLGFSRPQLVMAMRVVKQLILFVVAGMIIGKIVYLVGGTVKNPLGVSHDEMKTLQLSFAKRLGLVIVAICSVITNFILLVFIWAMPEKGCSSQLFLFKTCFVNFIMGIVEVKLFHNSITLSKTKFTKILPVVYLYTAAFLICGSTMGMCLSLVVTENNRLSEVVGKVTIFLDCYFALVALLCLICTINSMQVRDQIQYNHVPLGIPAIFACGLVLSIVIIVCTRYLRSRLPPTLEVEELNLKELTDSQKSAYAKLITFNSKANAGISGEAVLLLMESYTQTTLNGMTCKVLRVFHPKHVPKKTLKVRDSLGRFPLGSRLSKKGTSLQTLIDGTSPANLSKPGTSLDEERNISELTSKTWEAFDIQKTVFDEEETIFSLNEVEAAPKPLSKNQRKKLAKKAAAAAANGEGATFPLELNTEKDIAERAKFHEDLMATEALVLLTSIENYDLTASLQGKFGKFINKWFGSESKSKLLCVRFGLLAFHWPFVRSTFYCSQSKYPVARSGAVMYAISSWNKSQSKQSKCTILLDPTYKNAFAEQAIRFGGWVRLRLPSSHIINLRPHKNKTVQEYFKAIKYRNQDGTFKQAGGTTVEEKEFSEENCSIAMSLWKNIAENRTSNGNTSVLIDPNIQFMQTIGTLANEKHHRTLLFLKVDGEVIASCILFRLGDTITSDLQGLHQEKARPMKAYFVMMQEVIAIALREGKSFVDFGPTTEKPKVDIGCQSVPITGALRTSNVLLSMAVKIAALNVKV